MGQRGNYIIKSENGIEIFYTHWRAIHVTNDLMLGPEKFLKFVKNFENRNHLTNEPWIESCVYIDIDAKELYFWEDSDLTDTSVRSRYLEILSVQWSGWNVYFAEQEMYDIEAKMNLGYTNEQHIDFEAGDMNTLIHEEVGDYETTIVILKKNGNVYTKCSYDLDTEELIFLGEQIVDVLEKRESIDISKRPEIVANEAIAIDCDQKVIVVNYIFIGLKEELSKLWKGWTVDAGNYGYIQVLEKGGFDTTHLRMKSDEIEKKIYSILNKEDNFNPKSFAEEMLKKDKTVQFHPSFFENNKPNRSE